MSEAKLPSPNAVKVFPDRNATPDPASGRRSIPEFVDEASSSEPAAAPPEPEREPLAYPMPQYVKRHAIDKKGKTHETLVPEGLSYVVKGVGLVAASDMLYSSPESARNAHETLRKNVNEEVTRPASAHYEAMVLESEAQANEKAEKAQKEEEEEDDPVDPSVEMEAADVEVEEAEKLGLIQRAIEREQRANGKIGNMHTLFLEHPGIKQTGQFFRITFRALEAFGDATKPGYTVKYREEASRK